MRFIDEINIYIKAGNGGNGIIAWKKEANTPMGGAAGGNGGNGGNVIFLANNNIESLLDFQYITKIIANNGEIGKNKNMNGAHGKNKIIKLPLGTQIINKKNNKIIVDMIHNNKKYLICQGGLGGFGNAKYISSTNQSPYISKKGLPGEEKKIKLILKLIADIGLFGFPNAGKSTIISSISKAKTKIAQYPFTTLRPKLGIIINKRKRLIIADIPGIIKDASKGLGLGIKFLKHLERVKILCHIIEPNLNYNLKNHSMIQKYKIIRNELKKFNKKLLNKKEIVIITKKDIIKPTYKKTKTQFKQFLKEKNIKFLEISSLNKQDLKMLTKFLYTSIIEK